MRQAVFITGFNNWGKTTTIFDLFGRSRFYHGYSYTIHGVNSSFTVQSQSNDDLGGTGWIQGAGGIAARLLGERQPNLNLMAALCPSMEGTNQFISLLTDPCFSIYGMMHLFLLKYKWEHHSELIIPNITNAVNAMANINIVVINADINFTLPADRHQARLAQIQSELKIIFP